MADQQYCLRWNKHQQNFITIFKNLLDFEELVDVTLSVEGRHIKAHKVVLSACSPYFKLLFSITPSKHPIVILNDIKYKDLKTIIDFIYCGEISVYDEQLADILEVAETLQVRGLYDPKKGKHSSEDSNGNQGKKPKRKSRNNMPLVDFNAGGNEPNIEKVDPAQWVVEQYTNGCVTEYHANNLLQDHDENNTESTNGVDFTAQPSPHTSPYISSPTCVPDPTPVRRRSAKVQDSKNFLLALEAVRSGRLGFCKAAKVYGLNNRTLWLEYKKRGYPATRPPVGLNRKVSGTPTT